MIRDRARPHAKPVMSAGGYYVFMPLDGNGDFGAWSLADVAREDEKLHITIMRELTYEEVCRLCDEAANYMFYSLLASIPKGQGCSGAFKMCIPYTDGIEGRRNPYPHELPKHGNRTGGARV